MTVPVDSLGRAILDSHEQSNSNDGWLASRASDASAKCLNLSALLRLRWCRVIFLDVLGRKGKGLACLIHTLICFQQKCAKLVLQATWPSEVHTELKLLSLSTQNQGAAR